MTASTVQPQPSEPVGVESRESVVTVITGAAGAIGAEIASHLDGRGHSLVLIDLNDSELKRTWGGSRHRLLRADVTSEDSLASAAAALRESGSAVHHIVANVGAVVEPLGGVDTLCAEAWRDSIRINLDSAFYTVKAFLPLQRDSSGRRSIVFMSSVLAVRGSRFSIAYSAAKAGLLGLTTSLAQDLGGEGITVNAIAPAPVAKARLTELAGAHLEALRAKIPLGRICTPRDVANTVDYLTDPRSAFMTGQTITLDGGLSSGAWWHPYW